MNLGDNPNHICLWLNLPRQFASKFKHGFDTVEARHEMERQIQSELYSQKLDAYVSEGKGTVERGYIFITTPVPAAALKELKAWLENYKSNWERLSELLAESTSNAKEALNPSRGENLLPFVSIAWFDPEDQIYRTFHPLTTRPFWTLFKDPDLIEQCMQKGRSAKK
jgi:hypothetical protein